MISCDFLLDFEFPRQKLSKFNYFQFFKILFLMKITIFGAKIQIIQVNSQKSWLFSFEFRVLNFPQN